MLAQKNPYVAKIGDYPHRLIPFGQKPDPDWSKRFGRNAPLAIDLGSGAGSFLAQAAALRPDLNWLGVEVRFKRLVRSAEKAEKAQTTHLLFLQERLEKLAHWFAPNTVGFASINFPDPWPKRKQQKNRYLLSKAVLAWWDILAPRGVLTIKSDHLDYAGLAYNYLTQACPWHILCNFTTQAQADLPPIENFFPPSQTLDGGYSFSPSAAFLPVPPNEQGTVAQPSSMMRRPIQSEFEQLFQSQKLPIAFFALCKP